MLIDCDACEMQHTHHCADCVVTHMLEPKGAIVIDAAEERALRELADGGLVPRIRMRRRPRSA